MVRTIQIDIPHAALADLCRRSDVRELALFGSAVRDDFRPESDVDLLVTFADEARLDLSDFVALRDELSSLLARKVDLVEEKAIKNPYRRHAILQDKTVIYEQSQS